MLTYCRTCRCSNGFRAVLHAMIKLDPNIHFCCRLQNYEKRKILNHFGFDWSAVNRRGKKIREAWRLLKYVYWPLVTCGAWNIFSEGMFEGRWLNSSINGIFHDQIKANAFPILSWLSGFLFKSAEIPAKLL